MEKEKEDIKTHGIIINIPDNTIELTITSRTYENKKIIDFTGTYNLEEIKKAEKYFDNCCNGEYPFYILTDEREKWLEQQKEKKKLSQF